MLSALTCVRCAILPMVSIPDERIETALDVGALGMATAWQVLQPEGDGTADAARSENVRVFRRVENGGSGGRNMGRLIGIVTREVPEAEVRLSVTSPGLATNSVPGSYVGNFTLIYPDDRREGTPLDWRFATVDDQYFAAFDVEFLEGRNFSRDFADCCREANAKNE